MPLPYTSLIGNLTADPELRFIASGKAVASFTVACSERRKNENTQEWEDGDSIYIRCSAWEQVAENIAEHCVRGTSVVVTGRLMQRQYETREGEKRYSFECKVQTFAVQISASQTATPRKMERGQRWAGPDDQAPPPPDDPWASAPPREPAAPAASQHPDPWGAAPASQGYADEPPF